jgi:glyoxylase-like metal-dependent hydrolase (beta-lactamase superfamily II)
MKLVLLKEGMHPDNGPEGNPKLKNRVPEICGAVTLLKAENDGKENIIIDTGNMGYADEIVAALAKEGLKPEDIKFVINTHGHYDHLSNNYLFKNAIRTSGRGVWFIDKSLDVYKDIAEIPGIKLIKTPGHTKPHISVVVESGGKKCIIAGDAIQYEYIMENKWGVLDNKDYVDSAKKILALNPDVIIPGHGPVIEGEKLEELRKTVESMKMEE